MLDAAIINDGHRHCERRRAPPATRSANSLYENWLADTETDWLSEYLTDYCCNKQTNDCIMLQVCVNET